MKLILIIAAVGIGCILLRLVFRGLKSRKSEDFIPISRQALASILVERQEIQAAQRAGKALTEEEQKKLAMSEFLLGVKDGEPLIQTRELGFEEAKHMPAIGEFTLGQVQSLLKAQGLSQEDVIRFLRDVQSGGMTLDEANQFLKDAQEWEQIKNHTTLSRETFFAEKMAAHERARNSNPIRN